MVSPRPKNAFPKPPVPFTREDALEFCTAGKEGDIRTLGDMLDKFGLAIINERDNGGDTALSWAAWMGHMETTKYLLDRGAGIDSPGMQGKSSLIWATQGGRAEVVSLLLQRGASVDAKADNGDTALMIADRNQKTEVAGLIRLWIETQKHEAEMRKQEEEARILIADRLQVLKAKAPKIKLPPR